MIKDIRSHKKIFIVSIILLLVGGFIIQRIFFNSSSKQTETFTVTKGNLKEELVLSGEIQASENVSLHFQAGGQLSWIGVKKGDRVKKNETLASLDTRSVAKQIEKDLNDYNKARADFDQITRDTYKDSVFTDQIKRLQQKAQNDLDSSVLDIEINTIAQQYSYLVSPFDGIVTKVDSPLPGVNVTTTTTIDVFNPETLYFSLSADQTEVVKLKLGDSATILMDAFEQPATGKIMNISYVPKAGETGAVYEVKLNLEGSNSEYRIGMTGDATFVTQEKNNVMYVPSKFIKTDEKSQKYVLVGEKKVKTIIATGLETDENTEISSGLHEGNVIYD